MIRMGSDIVTVVFLLIGVIITLKIKDYQGDTYYEQTKHKEAQITALKHLWLVISIFFSVSAFMLAYDLYFYLPQRECSTIFDNPVANALSWFISRTFSDYLWVLPLIYLFWPLTIVFKTRINTQVKEERQSISVFRSNYSSEPNSARAESAGMAAS